MSILKDSRALEAMIQIIEEIDPEELYRLPDFAIPELFNEVLSEYGYHLNHGTWLKWLQYYKTNSEKLIGKPLAQKLLRRYTQKLAAAHRALVQRLEESSDWRKYAYLIDTRFRYWQPEDNQQKPSQTVVIHLQPKDVPLITSEKDLEDEL